MAPFSEGKCAPRDMPSTHMYQHMQEQQEQKGLVHGGCLDIHVVVMLYKLMVCCIANGQKCGCSLDWTMALCMQDHGFCHGTNNAIIAFNYVILLVCINTTKWNSQLYKSELNAPLLVSMHWIWMPLALAKGLKAYLPLRASTSIFPSWK